MISLWRESRKTLATAASMMLVTGWLFVSANAAAVTLTSPVDGSVVSTTHPLFTWTLDGTEINTITVSKLARTTPDGSFFDEDYVSGGLPESSSTSWQPTSPIAAGTYWWGANWYFPDFSAVGNTPPEQFSIAADIHNLGFRIRQYQDSAYLYATPSWWSNTATTRVTCKLYRRGKLKGSTSVRSNYPTIGGQNSDTCNLRLREKWDGLRFKLLVVVQGGGISRSKSKTFTAK